MSVVLAEHGPAAPLLPEHHAQIALARQQRKKLDRARSVASFNAWSFAIFAGCSLIFALFSVTSLIAAIVLAGLAYNEFRGRRQLIALNPQGPVTLGNNQLLCCAAITLYCGFKIYTTVTGPGPYEQAIQDSPEVAMMLEPMQDLLHNATLASYAIILLLGVTAQGLTARYYFSRKQHLNKYLQQTPDWLLDLERVQGQAAA